jgi:hypothetical protein
LRISLLIASVFAYDATSALFALLGCLGACLYQCIFQTKAKLAFLRSASTGVVPERGAAIIKGFARFVAATLLV